MGNGRYCQTVADKVTDEIHSSQKILPTMLKNGKINTENLERLAFIEKINIKEKQKNSSLKC
jgi:hypothetical protein